MKLLVLRLIGILGIILLNSFATAYIAISTDHPIIYRALVNGLSVALAIIFWRLSEPKKE